MEHGDVVADGPKGRDGRLHFVFVDEQIGDHHHHPGARDHAGRLHERAWAVGAFPCPGVVERVDNAAPLHRAGPGRNDRAHLVVEADEPDGVALAEQQPGYGGGDPFGVGELCDALGGAGPVHGLGDVKHDCGAEVGLLLELLDQPLIGARHHTPVEIAEVIAGLIGAMFGELDGESFAGRLVQPHQESFHDPTRNNLDPPEGGKRGRVDEVSALLGIGHW